VPAAARRAAAELLDHRGVLGVFWGAGKQGEVWTDEPCLVVHVRRKRAPEQLGTECLPRRRAGFRVDVLAVGRPSHHWLDPTDPVQCEDPDRGRSSITALGRRSGRTYAVLSGHGTLPADGDQLPGQYDPSSPMRVRALDPQGSTYGGQLLAGRLDARCDFTLAWMEVEAEEANHFHYAAGGYPPHTVRRAPLRAAEEVAHYSSLRRRRMIGRVRHIAAGHMSLPGYGGHDYPYLDLAVVESPDPSVPFSLPGDSGSLVVDGQRRVIGTVVAGEPSRNISYVLPITGTVAALGANARPFFKEEEA
jgi:hypothetical protein